MDVESVDEAVARCSHPLSAVKRLTAEAVKPLFQRRDYGPASQARLFVCVCVRVCACVFVCVYACMCVWICVGGCAIPIVRDQETASGLVLQGYLTYKRTPPP